MVTTCTLMSICEQISVHPEANKDVPFHDVSTLSTIFKRRNILENSTLIGMCQNAGTWLARNMRAMCSLSQIPYKYWLRDARIYACKPVQCAHF